MVYYNNKLLFQYPIKLRIYDNKLNQLNPLVLKDKINSRKIIFYFYRKVLRKWTYSRFNSDRQQQNADQFYDIGQRNEI